MSGKIIAVYGSARTPEDSAAYQEAYQLGRQLALSGYTVANGGYQGSMEAVSRGAVKAGGHVIGITCDLFDPRPPNRWLSEDRRTTDLLERLGTITSLADGFIALGGGTGTLSEVALTWSLLQTGQISPRPFILVGDMWHTLVDTIAQHTEMGSSIVALAQLADNIEEAMNLLEEWRVEHETRGQHMAEAADIEPRATDDSAPMPTRPPA